MEIKEFIIELLKYIAWPFVVLISIFILKDKLSSIFSGGIKSAKHGDTEVQFFEGKQPVKPEETEQQDLQHLIPVDPTGLRGEVEERIQSQLTQINNDNEKIDILVKNLAQQQISNAFEKVYYNIFGSQIRLLEFLAVQTDGKSDAETLNKFFETTKKDNPDIFKEWEFSDYMNFLVNWELVKNENNEWSITHNGRAFIIYITALQLNKNKSL